MIVLAVDTCLAACSVAVVDDHRTLASTSEPMTRGHQERLAPMARETMARAGLSFPNLDRIGVTVGPGSFTGLRVGLAFAKGLALALDIPCVGVGSLEALAAGAETPGVLFAVIDAGRGNLYLQRFEAGRASGAAEILPVEAAAARVAAAGADGRDVLLAGPGARALAGQAPGAGVLPLDIADPAAVARLAASSAATPPRPLYLRPPDARPKPT